MAVTLDSWGAACNSAWEAIRTHAALEAKASNALPSYADLLSQLRQLKQADDDLRRQTAGERDDLQSQLMAALKQLTESQENDAKAKAAIGADLLAARKDLAAREAVLAEAQKKLEDALKAIEDLKAKLAAKPAPTVVPEKKGCCS